MTNDQRITNWVASYKELAAQVLAKHIQEMENEFPEEYFPVRPPYRRAVYHHLLKMVDELNQKIGELLDESPDETDEPLHKQLMALQEGYELEFVRKVRKEAGLNTNE